MGPEVVAHADRHGLGTQVGGARGLDGLPHELGGGAVVGDDQRGVGACPQVLALLDAGSAPGCGVIERSCFDEPACGEGQVSERAQEAVGRRIRSDRDGGRP